jgi:hypothetical protein
MPTINYPPTPASPLCSKDEEREMRQYVAKLRMYFKGSDAMQATLEEAAALVEAAAAARAGQAQAQPAVTAAAP